MKNKKYQEEYYQEAALMWRKENPDVLFIPQRAVVTLKKGHKMPSGVVLTEDVSIGIGNRMKTMRKYQNLTEQEKEFWKDFGLYVSSIPTEEEYRLAALKYENEHPEKRGIPKAAKIEIDVETENGVFKKMINIGLRIYTMRRHIDSLPSEVKDFWATHGLFELENKKEDYKQAFIIWRKENPHRIAPTQNQKIVIDGKNINIGYKYNVLRDGIEKMSDEELAFWQEAGIFLDAPTEEEYREALETFILNNPKASAIDEDVTVVITNNKKIKLGKRVAALKRKPTKFNDEQIDYWFNKKIVNDTDVKPTKLRQDKYARDYGGNEEKANQIARCIDELKAKRKDVKKDQPTVDNLLEEFDVNVDKLNSILEKLRTNAVENGNRHKVSPFAPTMYQGETLRSYCIRNGYNYTIINNALKLHRMLPQDDLESLINRLLIEARSKRQNAPTSWIYEKYGSLLRHILIKLQLDPDAIIRNMKENYITLDEAIGHYIFTTNCKNKKYSWLEVPYNYITDEFNYRYLDEEKNNYQQKISDLDTIVEILDEEYFLDEEEKVMLLNTSFQYIKTIRTYQKIDVGFEKNIYRKMKKIEKYNLTDEEIEESYFLPLEFDKNILLGSATELYERRLAARNYSDIWPNLSDWKKNKIIKENKFGDEEINYLNEEKLTREKIKAMHKD